MGLHTDDELQVMWAWHKSLIIEKRLMFALRIWESLANIFPHGDVCGEKGIWRWSRREGNRVLTKMKWVAFVKFQ